MMPSSTSGWPTLALGGGDAVVTRHGDFEPAAERVAVNRGDERLGGVLERFQERVQRLPTVRATCSRVFNCLKTLMSAPAMNVVPAPIRTIASTAASPQARSTASPIALGHAGAQARSPAGCRS